MSTKESKVYALNIAQLRRSRNSLPAPARQAAIEALDTAVACAIDLSLAARQAHWNVRGPQFSALHALFGQIADELYKQSDILAERSAALGGMPRCTPPSLVASSRLRPYPSFSYDGAEHLDELSMRMSSLSTELRQSVRTIDCGSDPVTADLLTDACASVDHLLWLLDSHFPADDSGPSLGTPG